MSTSRAITVLRSVSLSDMIWFDLILYRRDLDGNSRISIPTFLRYEYVTEMETKRTPYRDAHLTLAKEWLQKGGMHKWSDVSSFPIWNVLFFGLGKLLFIGAWSDACNEAFLMFDAKNTSVEEIESYIQQDSYVQNGLVSRHTLRPMNGFLPNWGYLHSTQTVVKS